MKKLEKIVKIISGVLFVISIIGFFFITGITAADIVIRYVKNESILGVYELVERVMICAVFTSFAYAQTEHAHVQITLLVAMYPPKLKLVMMALNNLLSAAASILVAYAAMRQAGVALQSQYATGILHIPLYPFYWVVAVSMVALCITFLFDMVKSVCALFNHEIAEEIQSEWR